MLLHYAAQSPANSISKSSGSLLDQDQVPAGIGTRRRQDRCIQAAVWWAGPLHAHAVLARHRLLLVCGWVRQPHPGDRHPRPPRLSPRYRTQRRWLRDLLLSLLWRVTNSNFLLFLSVAFRWISSPHDDGPQDDAEDLPPQRWDSEMEFYWLFFYWITAAFAKMLKSECIVFLFSFADQWIRRGEVWNKGFLLIIQSLQTCQTGSFKFDANLQLVAV